MAYHCHCGKDIDSFDHSFLHCSTANNIWTFVIETCDITLPLHIFTTLRELFFLVDWRSVACRFMEGISLLYLLDPLLVISSSLNRPALCPTASKQTFSHINHDLVKACNLHVPSLTSTLPQYLNWKYILWKQSGLESFDVLNTDDISKVNLGIFSAVEFFSSLLGLLFLFSLIFSALMVLTILLNLLRAFKASSFLMI